MKFSLSENFNDQIWRVLTNVWTFAVIIFFILNFLSGDKYSASSTTIAIIYIAILGIYVGTKEFDRWQNHHLAKRRGELFIILWTVVMLFFIIAAPISGGKYKIPSEFSATYIAILSIFALTQRSKFLHNKKEQNNNQNNTRTT